MERMYALMRRFTIQTRMLGAIVMVVGLLLTVGGAALVGMFRIQGLSKEFVDTAFTESTHVSELNRHLGNLRRYEKDLIINYENAKEIERYKAQWVESIKLADAELRAIGAVASDAATTQTVRELGEHIKAYQVAFEPVIKQLEASSYDTATAINKAATNAKNAARGAEGKLAELRKLVQEHSTKSQAETQASVQHTLLAFGIALAGAIVLVVPLTLLNSRSIVQPILRARSLAQAIATGDLTQRIEVRGHDEVADLQRAQQEMQEYLRKLVAHLRESSESIQTASSEVASGNHDLSQRTEEAASSLQQTASSLTQLTGTVRQSADAAAQANQLASSASAVASRGGQVVSQVVSTMDEINASSKKISDIIGVIDGIAFQTNILALNAAVEAARAGEQGRGFAVVAGEVRSLAQRSAEAAKEIKALIGTSVDKVETGSRLVQDAGTTMNEIVASVQRVTDIIGEITAAASEQSSGIGQVNTAVSQLDRMTQQNAALVEESAAAAESLKEQAHKLNSLVAAFRLSEGAGDPAPAAPHQLAAQAVIDKARQPQAAAAPSSRAAGPALAMPTPAPTPAPTPTPAARPLPAAAPVAAGAKSAGDDGEWESF